MVRQSESCWKKYILIPIEKIEDMWINSNVGVEAAETDASMYKSLEQVNLVKHIGEQYARTNNEIAEIIAENK